MTSDLNCCAACPHAHDCRNVGTCLDDLNGKANPQSVPLMTPAQANDFMAALLATRTLRRITGAGKFGPAIAPLAKFRKHCKLYPEWGAEANRLAVINAKAADRLKGEPGRSKTHCMRGHSLADAYVCQHKQGPNAGYILRHCRQCTALRGREGFKIKSYVALAVTEKLKQHLPIRSFTTGGSPGYLVKHSTFNRYRRENLEFDELVKYSVSNRPIRRVLPTGSVPPGTYKYDWHPGDEAAIRALVPRWTQGREDIVNDIFVALLDGRLDRTQVVDYVKRFLAADDRMFPAKYAKFGDAKLVSLDARLFDDGTATLGDTVSRGLWD